MARRLKAGETYSITASEVLYLGDGSSEVQATMVVQFVSADFEGTVAPQAKVIGVVDDADYMDVAYRDASTEEVVPATTPLTNPALEIIEIPAGGRQIALDITLTAGTLEVTYKPVLG